MNTELYVGRIVLVGRTRDGRLCGAYRVSSRSFPNRTAVIRPNAISIVPKPGFETDVQKNPYIAYNAVRIVNGDNVAVVTNGSHTDPVAEKISGGMSVRDALALSSLILDYEKDDYNTPRISAVLDKRDNSAWLAIVREDGLEVARAELKPGTFQYVATYEENHLSLGQSGAFDADSAEDACQFILSEGVFAQRANPVTALSVMAGDSGFTLAARDK